MRYDLPDRVCRLYGNEARSGPGEQPLRVANASNASKTDAPEDYFGLDVPEKSQEFLEDLAAEVDTRQQTGIVDTPVFKLPKPKY